MNTGDLLRKWSRSYFADRDFIPSPSWATPKDIRESHAAFLANPNGAILENVEQSREDVTRTRGLYQEAQEDGLFDVDLYRTANKKQQAIWRGCVDIVRGDYQRAVSDLGHWREYASLAIEEKLPLPKEPGGWQAIVGSLADAKAVPRPDRRLPPENDEEIPF